MPKPHKAEHTRAHPKKQPSRGEDHPPAEDEFGGGDFCSPEESPPTDDDKPLD